jgi:hypothetical protein
MKAAKEVVTAETNPSLTHPRSPTGWLPVQGLTPGNGVPIVPGSRSKKVDGKVGGMAIDLVYPEGAVIVKPQSSTFKAPQVGVPKLDEGPTRPVEFMSVIESASLRSLTMNMFVTELALS